MLKFKHLLQLKTSLQAPASKKVFRGLSLEAGEGSRKKTNKQKKPISF